MSGCPCNLVLGRGHPLVAKGVAPPHRGILATATLLLLSLPSAFDDEAFGYLQHTKDTSQGLGGLERLDPPFPPRHPVHQPPQPICELDLKPQANWRVQRSLAQHPHGGFSTSLKPGKSPLGGPTKPTPLRALPRAGRYSCLASGSTCSQAGFPRTRLCCQPTTLACLPEG